MTELAGDNADKYCATNRWFEPGNAVRRYRLLLLTALAILLGEAAGAARYDAHERTGLPGGIDPVAAATHASRLHKPRRVAAGEVVQDFGPVETLARTADDDTHAGALPGAPRTAMAQDITAHEPDQASVASGDDRLIATCRQQFRRATAQRRVRFRFDSSVLQSSAYALLDALAEIAADCPGLRIRITGHTDASGDPVHNQFLSEQRAAAVRAYFVARGIRAERLTAIGKGASQPLDRGSDRAARARNRRIDFALVANE